MQKVFTMSQDMPKFPQTAIDQIANEGHLTLLKAAIPYLRSDSQKSLAIYAKILELGNIVRFFAQPAPEMSICSESDENISVLDMLNDLRSFCDESEKEMMDFCIHMIQTVQNLSSYQEIFQNLSSDNQNPIDLMKNFLTPEQKTMFETYQTILKS
ncbi:MAG: hypothetical protein SO016_07760 [Lachnospiraceae bacterium]|nr:hypothetical protein [Robinsoniella sp.]MDY3766571.1 hypothetical protein [Lachnospiraceae bacterium]